MMKYSWRGDLHSIGTAPGILDKQIIAVQAAGFENAIWGIQIKKTNNNDLIINRLQKKGALNPPHNHARKKSTIIGRLLHLNLTETKLTKGKIQQSFHSLIQYRDLIVLRPMH